MTEKLKKRLFAKLFNVIGIPYYYISDKFEAPTLMTLYDIANCLNKSNIRNLIVRLHVQENIPLPCPAIAEKKGLLYLILNTNKEGVTLFDPVKNEDSITSYKAFNSGFSPDILLLEKIDTDYSFMGIGDEEARNKLVLKCLKITGFLLVVLLSILFLYSGNILIGFLTLINILGLIIVGAYFLKEHNVSNTAFELICSKQADNSPCLSPDQKNIFIISFSKLGTTFFLTAFFSLSLSIGEDAYKLPIFYTIMSIMAIPFVLISIYVQLFKVKKICMICMLTNTMVLINLFILLVCHNLFFYDYSFLSNLGSVIIGFLILSLVFVFSFYLKADGKKRLLKQKHDRVWSDKYMIEAFLEKQDDLSYEAEKCMTIGSEKATESIVLIMYVDCKYCQDAFWHLGNLALLNEKYNLLIFIKYDFSSAYDKEMMSHFAMACIQNNFVKAHRLLRDWKSDAQAPCPTITLQEEAIELINENRKFFKMNNIEHFPAAIINGKKVPNFIGFENIKLALT